MTETRKLLHWLMRPSGSPRGRAAYDDRNKPSWVPDELFKSPTAKYSNGRYKMSRRVAEDNLQDLVAVFYQTFPTIYDEVRVAVERNGHQMPARYQVQVGPPPETPAEETVPPPANQTRPGRRPVRPRPPCVRSHADDRYRTCRGEIPNRHKCGPRQQRLAELAALQAAVVEPDEQVGPVGHVFQSAADPDEQEDRDRDRRGNRERSRSSSPLSSSDEQGRDGGRERSRSPLGPLSSSSDSELTMVTSLSSQSLLFSSPSSRSSSQQSDLDWSFQGDHERSCSSSSRSSVDCSQRQPSEDRSDDERERSRSPVSPLIANPTWVTNRRRRALSPSSDNPSWVTKRRRRAPSSSSDSPSEVTNGERCAQSPSTDNPSWVTSRRRRVPSPSTDNLLEVTNQGRCAQSPSTDNPSWVTSRRRRAPSPLNGNPPRATSPERCFAVLGTRLRVPPLASVFPMHERRSVGIPPSGRQRPGGEISTGVPPSVGKTDAVVGRGVPSASRATGGRPGSPRPGRLSMARLFTPRVNSRVTSFK